MGNNQIPVSWRYGLCYGVPADLKDKAWSVSVIVAKWLDRLQSMFRYDGLPETIPKRDLDLILMTHGTATIAPVNGSLYAFAGTLGGQPNPYYLPTLSVIANPGLEYSASLKIDEECVVIRNDSMMTGILPILNRYATLTAETDLSIRNALIWSRADAMLVAKDDDAKKGAAQWLSDLEAGRLGSAVDPAWMQDGIRAVPTVQSGHQALTDLIEIRQYLVASLWNTLGLNANYNMKRESINSSEANLNADALLPLVDDMLRCRRAGVEAVNKMYGTTISVDYASAWEDNAIELDAAQDAAEAAAEDPEPDAAQEPEPKEGDDDAD